MYIYILLESIALSICSCGKLIFPLCKCDRRIHNSSWFTTATDRNHQKAIFTGAGEFLLQSNVAFFILNNILCNIFFFFILKSCGWHVGDYLYILCYQNIYLYEFSWYCIFRFIAAVWWIYLIWWHFQNLASTSRQICLYSIILYEFIKM